MDNSSLLPGFERAIIDVNHKLVGYVLNPAHPYGRHKARVFLAMLGLTQSNAQWLSSSILMGLRRYPAVLSSVTDWGDLYHVDMDLMRGSRCAKVRTSWICAPDETRLTTCFVKGDCDETA